MDIAILPARQTPARFHSRALYEEEFVIAMRSGHPFATAPTLDRYCELRHLVVSQEGDPHGFVDHALAAQGRSRRVALTVPNFMFALAALAGTDFVAALPRRLVALHAARFDVVAVESPLALERFRVAAIVPQVAMMDAGLAWLFELLGRTQRTEPTTAKRTARRPARRP